MKRAARPDAPLAAQRTATLPRWVDGFLSEPMCNKILDELEITLWKPSTVVYRRSGGELRQGLSRSRRSETAHEQWFSPELKRVLRRIDSRLARLLGHDPVRHEAWQATRYRRGDTFQDHFDAGHWSDDPHGERERSVVIYLRAPARGGGTRFRELGLDVQARVGRLLTWGNLLPNGEPDPRMLHAGTPVTRGVKIVLVTWIRQNDTHIGRRRKS